MLSSSADEIPILYSEIQLLKKTLNDKIQQIYIAYFKALLNINTNMLVDTHNATQLISCIKVTTRSNKWSITYNHHTPAYDENNYNYNHDSDTETELCCKTFTIIFGRDHKRYYIKGNHNNRFKIYKNSQNEISVINKDYDIELDLEEHTELIMNYSNNKNIPEWLALKVFIFIKNSKWADQDLLQYLAI